LLKEKVWLGYISLNTLMGSKETSLELLVDDELSKIHFYGNQHLYEIYPTFEKSKLEYIAVINSHREFLGSASKSVIGEHLLNTLTYKGIGSIIVLRVYHTDFVLSRIASIVEENNVKIVGMMIEEVGQYYRVNLKLNTIEIAPILSSFSRFSIEVESYHNIADQDLESKKAFDIAFKHFDL